ncbi:hypothetical protein CL651_002325 [bacterium]|nr:hypothetical protein [bacterium]|tara:strand:+ start:15346 stop:15666 length:321 start_codon:yes stop_codon:yes gene_type:complete
MVINKHRKGKIMRKHSRIKNLDSFLEKFLEPISSIKLITPGAIKVGKGKGENLKVTYGREIYQGNGEILVGCKLNATSGNSNQEVFVSTSKPEEIKKIIQNLNDKS